MTSIQIKSIPASRMRIPGSLGDYWYDESGVLQVRVAEMENRDFETLIAVHEILEENGTRRRGLTEPEIQAFDEMWDKEQQEGKHPADAEPGFDPRAPYLHEHTASDATERFYLAFWGLDFSSYEQACMEAMMK